MANYKIFIFYLLILTGTTLLISPVSLVESKTQSVGDYATISVTEAKNLLLNSSDQYMQPNIFVLDVRTQTEYNTGYIEGATLIPHTEINTTNELPTNKSDTILVYCGSGMRSANASQDLDGLGYTNVYNMDGGLNAWKTAGYFLTVPVYTFKNIILDNSDNYVQTELFILDARTQAEFDAGYIDGATLIPHSEVKTCAQLPMNKSEMVLVYCGSGKRSANASQSLEDLGYTNVRNMAGGLGAWKTAGYFVTIPIATAKTLIEDNPEMFILDVRSQGEYDSSHIVDAVLIPHTEIASRVSELPTNKSETILVYCGSGKRSANASQSLEELGYTNIRNMAGGLGAWIAAGYLTNLNVTTTPQPPAPTSGFSFAIFFLVSGVLGVATIQRRKRNS